MDNLNDFMTISQVKKEYNKKDHQVRYALRKGLLKFIQPNWEIFVDPKSIPESWKSSKEEG